VEARRHRRRFQTKIPTRVQENRGAERCAQGESDIRISVVTVCFNSAETIADTLRSVAEQTYTDVEHIIVDGGSSDATLTIVDAHRRGLARVISEPDRGPYDAMNKGIAAASGEVVGFLNADDVYADAQALAAVAEAFAHPEVDACYADLVYVDRKDPERIVRYWKSRDFCPGLFRRGWMPAHPTFYVRRRVFERYGGFDLRYPRQADFELAMRLLELHHVVTRYIPRILVRMRKGGLSNSSYLGILRGNLEAYRACRNCGMAVTPLFMLRKVLSRLPQFFCRPPPPAASAVCKRCPSRR